MSNKNSELLKTESNMVNSTKDFKQALTFVLKHEGGYVNHPSDPGKETKWGISKKAYPDLDIAGLTAEQAADIYWNDYWLKAGCDRLPFPFNVVVFDTAVNCGVARAVGWLKETEDTPAYIEKRKLYYYKLVEGTSWAHKFIRGWVNRLNDLKKFVTIYSEPL